MLYDQDNEEEFSGYEGALAKFFRKKVLYDLRSFSLNKLDIDLMKNKNQPQGTEI